MIRIIAIVVLIALAFVLVRYNTNQRLQKGVVITILAAFIIYLVTLVITELAH
ncbi:hypothetical protein [Vibrio viridaestus]|uniref:hypothetical protein n=1 Tax=Vibrio viridaestus TaxID=2487322 RepID=UPI00140C9FAC|nr:hypothetical protein [Vibrio viridaestus]